MSLYPNIEEPERYELLNFCTRCGAVDEPCSLACLRSAAPEPVSIPCAADCTCLLCRGRKLYPSGRDGAVPAESRPGRKPSPRVLPVKRSA